MKKEYLGITIDYSRDRLLTKFAVNLLQDFYMRDDEASPQEAFARAATCFCYGDYELAQRIYDYASKQWMSFSSPVLSNAYKGEWGDDFWKLTKEPHHLTNARILWRGETGRALPISCFLSFVPDTIEGQIAAANELASLSIVGGGVGQHFRMRGITEKSPGAIPYLKTSDSNIMYYKQGKTRKGSVAAYLDVSHPDIQEFINVRVPTGGDINRKCLNVHNAVNITTSFIEAVREGSDWCLCDPNTGSTTSTVSARELWHSILETRFRTGEPYINYIDEANKHLHPALKDRGMEIHGSNLCNEIHLPTDINHTAVCCLSSLNLEYFDEWKGTTIVEDIVRFLDNVLQWFIDNAPTELEKANRAAYGSRDLGLGAMGFHSYLQKHNIPFESGGFNSAAQLSHTMFKHIKDRAIEASETLAEERGEPPYLNGTGRRNAHLLAIAPNANSSIIAGCSASIEPIIANVYTHRTRLGSVVVKNKHLEKLLNKRYYELDDTLTDNLVIGHWLEKQWKLIMEANGSVQWCPYLTDEEKAVYKTFEEIDQMWVVEHARIRQQHICQGQSVNLCFPPGSDKRYVNKVHLAAFSEEGNGVPLKGLYYLRTSKSRTTERINTTVERQKLTNFEEQEECLSCQG